MAGVASITVYATFRTKRAILTRLIHVSLVGDQEPGPLLEREGPQTLAREPNQVRQVTMFADAMGEIMERVSPIFEVMRNAAFTEPEITDLLDRLLSQRLTGMRFFIDALLRNGPLRPGLMPDAAAETVWALSSPDLHRLLTRRLGWNRDRYATWLSETLLATLLSR